MSREAILNAKVWPRIGMDHAPTKNAELLANSYYKAELATQLLLYDRIIIPTNDFGIVPILANWMGYSTFVNALLSKSVEFIRLNSCLGYVGNGIGLSLFRIEPGDSKELYWWQTTMFGELNTSLELQLLNSMPEISKSEVNRLHDLVITSTSEFQFENDDFIKNVANESYLDAQQTQSIREKIAAYYKSNSPINLNHLPGVNGNQMRASGIEIINDAVDLILRVAEVNIEIELAAIASGADIFTSSKTEDILYSKLNRERLGHESIKGLTQLFELTNLPNIESVVANDKLHFSDVWLARSSKNAKSFRKWFRKATIEDARDIEKAYVDSLNKIPSVASLPTKTLRFVVTTAAGLVWPPAGLAAGAVDNFFLEKWLSGYNPRLFIDEMRKLDINAKTT
ncbi:MAG: hypothetical protein KZQ97_21770 [Candidatus Thiodiazotropha sp. (ex Dulcina madagascariensis)]|nr:hypothetical protein [Candidatus Thiodiazotropha sp. (ex Dulcina madagascariensis)]